MNISNIIDPRNNILIKNKYEIIGDSNKYSLVIFYIDDNNCNIVVDKLVGVDSCIDLYLVIYDINEKYSETIKINNNNNNYNLPSIRLYKDEILLEQEIPKIIMQTFETNTYINEFHQNAVRSWINLNPEYKYVYYNSLERRQFIKENYNETTLLAYDTLICTRHKIDLFKYCWLYKNGGCYCSYKTCNLKSLRSIINPQDTYVLCSIFGGINDNFIIINKLNDKIYEIIQHMVWLINEKLTKYKINIFYSLKSSYILSKFFKDYNIRLKTNNKKIHLNDKVIVVNYQTNYKSTYQKIYNYFKKLKEHNIRVLKNREQIGNYIFYVYKNYSTAYFTFNIFYNGKSNILKITNIKQQGWNFDLIIKIIDHNSNKEYIITVGKSKLHDVEIPILLD